MVSIHSIFSALSELKIWYTYTIEYMESNKTVLISEALELIFAVVNLVYLTGGLWK